jgi:hypothetical protein
MTRNLNFFIRLEEKIAEGDSAWIDLKKRKLISLPDNFLHTFLDIPRTDDFEFDLKK